jgi:flagellar biogenesis protein FliO
MPGMMEQYFVQASPIKYLATLVTLGEVLFFVGRLIFVLVRFHEPIAHCCATL